MQQRAKHPAAHGTAALPTCANAAQQTVTQMGNNDYIEIRGARVNNLKDIDLDIPRDRFIAVTGVSGSGKSSLAFDLLYAEGQRRYMESLSAYSRQFLGQMKKPNCDRVDGIPPAIAIEQKVNTTNPRSTVGTATEIYDYLSMLYARIGKVYSPVTGEEVKRDTVENVIKCITGHDDRTRFLIMARVTPEGNRTVREQLDACVTEGYSRVFADGKICNISDINADLPGGEIWLVIDRATAAADNDSISRFYDSIITAFDEGRGRCRLLFYTGSGTEVHDFSNIFDSGGEKFEEPNDQLFNFNSPYGACPECDGFGKVLGIDRRLVIPNTALSVYDGAVACWRGDKTGEWKTLFIQSVSDKGFPVFAPYYSLTEEQKAMLWDSPYGINSFFNMVESNLYKVQYRVMLSRYRGKTTCPVCGGTRLRKEAGYVRIGGKNISQVATMPISDIRKFFSALQLTETEQAIGKRLLAEINRRLDLMEGIGLGYLTLDRLANSLSGGESQRINLIKSIGSSLVGSLYVLDEPSIGLHSKDTEKLVRILKELRDIGNTVLVVEHDEDIIREADYIIDIGRDAGSEGGEVVFAGTMKDMDNAKDSHTADYLLGRERISPAHGRRVWNRSITVAGARENNLKDITVTIPLNVMTVITGVSGSGKSTLVKNILYPALTRELDIQSDRMPGEFDRLEGDIDAIDAVEYVDQNPIGRSSRSNPVTYIKAYDEIRKLFADQQLSKQMGYTASTFSFNTAGGRCEECKGEGTVTIEMQFMADIVLECESCHGRRFKPDVLEVQYDGKSIYDILEMTVNDAFTFFKRNKQNKIAKRLKLLQDVGLGYVKLGQPSSTLSGGESQRVKLAYFLGMETMKPTMFIFDEPTTGLHFHDIRKLVDIFDSLIDKGHTIVIIEHNMEIIKCADHIIDLGPEGGEAGGYVVATGRPEDVCQCQASYTGKYLKQHLNNQHNNKK